MDETSATVEIKAAEEIKPVTLVVDEAAAKAPVISADEGIQSLKDQVEQAQRQSAERLAEKDRIIQDAFQRASAAETELTTVKKDQVGTIIDSLQKDKDAAKRDYKLAMEAGDFEKAAEAQDRISLANSRIVAAEQGKMALESEVKPTGGGRSLAQPVTVDNVERVARSMTPRSGDWIRRHPDLVRSDGTLSPAALSAHYAAENMGITGDTPEYFDHLEATLYPQQRRQAPEPSREQGRDMNRAPISAPVGRDAPQSPGAQRPGTMTLSANEVRTAIDTLTPLYPKATREEILQEYAKNKQRLISENHPNYGGR